TLPPSIEVAIAKSIASPPRKRTCSPSSPPPPSPSPSPRDTIVEATTEAVTLAPCKRFWMTPLHLVATVEAMAKYTTPRKRSAAH
ncbi:hypothetical protein Tco_1578722, partial [Tanacetum coccineum]